jgi:sugar lactone lactonase YvrE
MLKSIGIVLAVVALYLLAWPVPIDAVAWHPGIKPDMVTFQADDVLGISEVLASGVGHGPEDVTLGPDGYFYTGLQDGRILRFRGSVGEEFVNTGGRPLGMQFDAQGNLIVADAFRGLLAVAPDRAVTVLAYEVDGEPMKFPDDLDIAADGTIWFSDASQRFDQHNWKLDVLEGRATGRLLSYDPSSSEVTVRLEGLMFANGVALGPDDEYVLVNETFLRRIMRLWLKGPRAGESEIFIAGLPGYPDNLSFDGQDTFWIAMPSRRQERLENLARRPLLREILMRLPEELRRVEVGSVGWVVAVSTDAKVRYSLKDTTGRCFAVTSANDLGGSLLMGSLDMHHICRLSLPPPAGSLQPPPAE